LYDNGERDAASILQAVRDRLGKSPLVRLEYAKICDVVTLRDLAELEQAAVLALAAKVGRTRLIDNYVFGEKLNITFR
jgi:pantoate--beta-alanine ligase